MIIRPAAATDLPALRPVFEAAKGIMRADGNLDQWSAPASRRRTSSYVISRVAGDM